MNTEEENKTTLEDASDNTAQEQDCEKKKGLIARLFSGEIGRIIRFAFVGGINSAVDYAVFFVMHTLLCMESLPAQAISFTCGTACSYILNRRFTFKTKKKMSAAEIIKFVILNVVAMGSSMLIVYIFDNRLGISPYIAKLVAMAVSFVINYTGNRFLIFKSTVDEKNASSDERKE